MTELSYKDRIEILRQKKVEHTLEKVRINGYMDADDYGTAPLPEDFKFSPVANHPNGGFYGAAAWAENYSRLMSIHPVYVDPLEALCGRWMTMLTKYRVGWPEDLFPYDHLKPAQQLYGIVSGIGSDSHFACDYEMALTLGFGGVLDKIRKYRKTNPEQTAFYDAEEKVVLAIQDWIGRHIAEIERLLVGETRPEIQSSLKKMLYCNRNIITKAPETFQEACQWIAWFNCASRIFDRDGAGCSLDMVLLPYFERDIGSGKLTEDEARFLLANLLLIETHYYQLSGANVEGRDLTNKLSWLVLEAAHWLNTSNNLTVRVHDNIDPAFFKKAVEYLFTDRNGWPRFSGDRGLMGYARNQGLTKEDARQRIAVGCNWMAVPGREYPMNDCVKINVAKVFEVAFHEMMDSAEPSLEKLFKLLENHLKQAAEVTSAGINMEIDYQHEVMPELVMNLYMKNTIEKGLDITQCAELMTIGVDGVGLGTVADSFAAIEQRVVREGRSTWEELHKALHSNFQGSERLRLMLKSSERYCQGASLGDKWAEQVSSLFTRVIKEQPMPPGRTLVPGWFSWSNTIIFGKQVGATPDGRHAYTPITHGANPNPGFRTDGAATAMATGIARIQPGYGNTAPLQLEFDPQLSKEEGGVDRVAALIKAHVDMGGTLVNINVLDKQKLMEAHKNPMMYPDLVVRVTGFTAYFVALSPEFRQLVVDRFIEGV
jgi:pyruvate-formate lyase